MQNYDETANLFVETKDDKGNVVKKRSSLKCNFYRSIPGVGIKGKVVANDGTLLNKDWQPLKFACVREFRTMLPAMKNSGYDTCEVVDLGGMPKEIFDEIYNSVYGVKQSEDKTTNPAIKELIERNKELSKQNEELQMMYLEMSEKINELSKGDDKEIDKLRKQCKKKDIPFSESDSVEILKQKLQ